MLQRIVEAIEAPGGLSGQNLYLRVDFQLGQYLLKLRKTWQRQPVLAVTKTGPQMRYVGRNAKYQITVSNTGDAPARDTVLTDVLPANATLVEATEGGQVAQGRITWQLGTLDVGQSTTRRLTLRSDRIGKIRNTASAKAYCTHAEATIETDIRGIPAILLELIDIEDPIEVGARVTYQVTVTNQGSATGTNIQIVCDLPAEERFVSATGPTRETVEGQRVTFAKLATLAAKAKATYRIVVEGTGVGDVRFKVSLTSDQMTSPAEETESTHIYE